MPAVSDGAMSWKVLCGDTVASCCPVVATNDSSSERIVLSVVKEVRSASFLGKRTIVSIGSTAMPMVAIFGGVLVSIVSDGATSSVSVGN